MGKDLPRKGKKRNLLFFHPFFAGFSPRALGRAGISLLRSYSFPASRQLQGHPLHTETSPSGQGPLQKLSTTRFIRIPACFFLGKPPSPPALWRGRRPAGDARTTVRLQPPGTSSGSPTRPNLPPFWDLGLWGCSLGHQPGDPANISSRTGGGIPARGARVALVMLFNHPPEPPGASGGNFGSPNFPPSPPSPQSQHVGHGEDGSTASPRLLPAWSFPELVREINSPGGLSSCYI